MPGYRNREDELDRIGDGLAHLPGEPTHVLWKGTTTDDTPTELFIDGVTDSRFVVVTNSAALFRLFLTARSSTGSVSAMRIDGAIKRTGETISAPTLSFINKTVQVDEIGLGESMIAVTADTTNKSLKIEVTGAAVTTINWIIQSDMTENK